MWQHEIKTILHKAHITVINMFLLHVILIARKDEISTFLMQLLYLREELLEANSEQGGHTRGLTPFLCFLEFAALFLGA